MKSPETGAACVLPTSFNVNTKSILWFNTVAETTTIIIVVAVRRCNIKLGIAQIVELLLWIIRS